MRETRIIMGMPVTVEIPENQAAAAYAAAAKNSLSKVFAYFTCVDEKFSTYKETSEITKINRGELAKNEWSDDMKTIFALAKETKAATSGYFDILNQNGRYDPSGIVKGWAIRNAAKLLEKEGYKNYYVEAGGDIEVRGTNKGSGLWRIGIQNPFDKKQFVKTVYLTNTGIATSGSYIRGDHIYNPKNRRSPIKEIVSLTVIGPDIFEADRFATAAFAMGKNGIAFIEKLSGFEGYMIDQNGTATLTSGFEKYTRTYLNKNGRAKE